MELSEFNSKKIKKFIRICQNIVNTQEKNEQRCRRLSCDDCLFEFTPYCLSTATVRNAKEFLDLINKEKKIQIGKGVFYKFELED